MKTKITFSFLAIFMIAFITISALGQSTFKAPNTMFIYGTVTTEDGDTYTGQIRWDDEEAYWFDMFNGDKLENENLEYLSSSDRKSLDKKDSDCGSNWSWGKNNWGNSHIHDFAIQFGNIKKLKVMGREEVLLTFHNGETMEVEDGSNDFDATIYVYTTEFGSIGVEWDELDKVEFMQAPNDFQSAIGEPVYGTVKTRDGDFTGFIQWDKDERVGEDKIDGKTDSGELSIAFEKIYKIEKAGSGSRIELHSGRSFHLDGTNDVDEDNRGIIVNIPNMGRVEIEWRDFIELTMQEVPNNMDVSYPKFSNPKTLEGTVETTDGQKYNGRIIYDLDEEWSFEILDGDIDDIEYAVLIGNVYSVTPKNDHYSKVVLKDGNEYLFEKSVDVDENNDGILVFSNDKNKPTYIAWEKVKTVVFQ